MTFGGTERRRAGLSIAPLIDIVFLLLVFFMLAGSFLNLESLDLATPGTAAPSGGETSPPLVVRLHDDGTLTFDSVVVDPGELGRRVRQALAENPEPSVLVVASAGDSVKRLIAVVDDIRLAGVEAVAIAVQDEP